MNNSIKNSTLNKEKLIEIMTDNLPALRAKIGLSQDEISNLVGILRQTYCAIETRKRKMAWSTFMSLLFIFWYNDKTNLFVKAIEVFPKELQVILHQSHQDDIVSE